VITVLVLLFAWALRLQRLDFQDIWWDEARNIEVATQPLAQIAMSPRLDIHPPLYFYSLHLWTQFIGASAFATRFFSVWLGLLTVALTCRLARGLCSGYRGRLAGLLALTLAAVSPYALGEAQETRMYTLSWALLSAGMLALWQATSSQPRRHRWLPWAAFVLLAAASLLTHYAVAFILASWAVWLLAWALRGPDRLARLQTLAIVGAAMLLLCLPVVPIALRQMPGYHNPNLNLPTLSGYLSQLYRAFTLGEVVPAGPWAVGRWLWLLLPLGGALLALRQQHQRSHVVLLGLWLVGGLAMYYGVLIRRPAFDPRYISFILPALWALAGWALTGWRRLARPLPWLMTAALLAVSVPSLHADLTDPQFFHDDARGVAAWLQAHATPQDIVLVDQAYPFGFYWQRWNNDAYGFPPAEPADQSPAQYLFVDLNHLDERLTALVGKAQTVYWVTWYESDMDPRGAVTALLDATGECFGEQPFRGYTVSWWRLRPPTDFRLARQFLPVDVRFEPGMTLLEADWQGRLAAMTPGHPALVTLRWQAAGPTSRPLKVSMRLRDEGGAMVAQDDRVLLNDRHLRTTSWLPGESALALYSLQVPPSPGTYTVTLVLYDEASLEPASLADGSGAELELGTLRTTP
jgi:hypothetical protein